MTMKDQRSPGLSRRAALALVPGLALPAVARAQSGEWPNRTVRYINPYPPGGPTDTLSRIYCGAGNLEDLLLVHQDLVGGPENLLELLEGDGVLFQPLPPHHVGRNEVAPHGTRPE